MRNYSFISKIKHGLLAACFLMCSFFSSLVYSQASYIPVQSGQTLLQIAKKAHPNYSVSVQQLAYAIYQLNPNAFENNMNALKKGAKLRLPEKNNVLNLSKSLANKKITQHEQEILILRASAKRLNTAKKRYQKNKQKVRSIRKELAKYQHKSSKWNQIYLKFITARRAEKKSARNVKKQRNALLAKTKLSKNKPLISESSTSKPTAPEVSNDIDSPVVTKTIKVTEVAKATETEKTAKSEQEDSALVIVKEKIAELQAQVQILTDSKNKNTEQYEQVINTIKTELDTSKQQLVAKTNEQDVIMQRVDVLESDQAEKEKLILSLQSSLKETAETVKQQQTENKDLLKKVQTLSSDTLVLKQQQEQQRLDAIRAAAPPVQVVEIPVVITPTPVKEQTITPNRNQLALVKSSLAYWIDRTKERPLIAFSVLGSLLLLFFFYMIKRQRISRGETRHAIDQLESKLRPSPINNRKITV